LQAEDTDPREFFGQLTTQGLIRSLSRLDESSREIPRPGVRLGGAPGEQDAPTTMDDGDGGGHGIVVERPAAPSASPARLAALADGVERRAAEEAEASRRHGARGRTSTRRASMAPAITRTAFPASRSG